MARIALVVFLISLFVSGCGGGGLSKNSETSRLTQQQSVEFRGADSDQSSTQPDTPPAPPVFPEEEPLDHPPPPPSYD